LLDQSVAVVLLSLALLYDHRQHRQALAAADRRCQRRRQEERAHVQALVLDAPFDSVASRLSGRTRDRFEREQRDFFERVRTGYLERAAELSRCVIIDAAQPLGRVQADIVAALAPLLRGAGER